jgi:hypothetical protein
MKILLSIFLFCFVFGFSQKYSRDEKIVLLQAKKLDSLMMKNDSQIVALFCSDVSFGHSNGWIQNLDDFKKDFSLKKSVIKKSSNLKFQN